MPSLELGKSSKFFSFNSGLNLYSKYKNPIITRIVTVGPHAIVLILDELRKSTYP